MLLTYIKYKICVGKEKYIVCVCMCINIEQTNLAKRFVGKIMQCDNNMREKEIYRRH